MSNSVDLDEMAHYLDLRCLQNKRQKDCIWKLSIENVKLKDWMSNSVDLEIAHDEPSHLDLRYLHNQSEKRLQLETENTLRIRKWESRFLLWLFINNNDVCNTAYAL